MLNGETNFNPSQLAAMYKLTTFTEIDGAKKFKDHEARTKQLTLNQAGRYYGSRKWEIYAGKHVVRTCANSSEVAQIYKVL